MFTILTNRIEFISSVTNGPKHYMSYSKLLVIHFTRETFCNGILNTHTFFGDAIQAAK